MSHDRLLADRLGHLASYGDSAFAGDDPTYGLPDAGTITPVPEWAAGRDATRTDPAPRIARDAVAAPPATASGPLRAADATSSILDVPAPAAAPVESTAAATVAPTVTAPVAPTVTAPVAPTVTAPVAPTVTAPVAPTFAIPVASTAATPAASTTGHVNDAVDAAVYGPQARAATGETGAGVTIGILSDSFNDGGQLAAEEADGDLPSYVDILKDGTGGLDEGMAMAEIVHSIAPGAAIDFYTAFASEADFASGITALVNAGANIIVDDITYFDEPFYQNAGPVTLAAEAAVQRGVSYFTSAGNSGANYYEASYNGVSKVSLPGLTGETSVHEVTIDGTATPYIPINVATNVKLSFSLEWTQPYQSTGGGQGSAYGIGVAFYDATGKLLMNAAAPESFADPNAVGADPVVTGTLDNTSTSTSISVVFYQNVGVMPANMAITFKLDFVNDYTAPVTGSLLGAGSGSVAGHADATGVNTVNAIKPSNAPADGGNGAPEPFDSVGPGADYYNTAGQSVAGSNLANPVSDGEPAFLAPDGNTTGVSAFQTFTGTSAAAPAAAAVAALVLQADPTLTPAQVTQILASTATPDKSEPLDIVGAGTLNADAATLDALSIAACYLRGTRIATPDGDRPIEELAIGDLVLTASGGAKPVRWLGRRSYAGRMLAGRPHLLPVTIRAGALGDGAPRRDLRVSPRHAMLLDGILAPAAALVNGASIVQELGYDRVDYIHIELETHDAILAEGAASETFMDAQGRGLFQNAAEYAALYPDANVAAPALCAPWTEAGPVLDALRRRLGCAGAA